MLEEIKLSLRISNNAFDNEIIDLFEAARHDLMLSGVSSEKVQIVDDIYIITEVDPLIKRAIIVYVKANFGFDNPDSDKLNKSYDMLKSHLTLSQDYNSFTIVFNVTEGINPIEDVTITFNGMNKVTNSSGITTFKGVDEEQNMKYIVTKDGYETLEETVDIEESQTISVSLAVV